MLISCIMPTRGRPALALEALECYLSQTWREKELVIVDDADDRSFAEAPTIAGVRYFLALERLTIGAKRNYACQRADGDIIAHFDDDDWSAPGRLADQAKRLIETGAQLTGYHSMRFQLRGTNDCWMYRGSAAIALGTSQCYLRSFWKSHKFPNLQLGEDMAFAERARMGRRSMVSVAAGDSMVSWVHDSHTSERLNIGKNSDAWRRCEPLQAHKV